MSIDNINVKSITVFEDLNIDFSKGINVISGENGTGKTTLIKMIYAACEWSNENAEKDKSKNIMDYFNYGKSDLNMLKKHGREDAFCGFKIKSDEREFEYSISHGGIVDYEQWLGLGIQSVFIPTTEMLSHSKGFLAMNRKYSMPFDATQIDIIVNAELPETREVSNMNKELLESISGVIDGEVVYENDTFYVLKKNGLKVEFSLEAEGLRKFGLLWKLIRNGLIEEGSVLLWDEPEANINPELIPLLVDILLKLQRNGVQIFIATHSYNLAKYFEIKRTEKDQVLFLNLYKQSDDSQGKKQQGVKCESNEYFGELSSNPIISADTKLLDEVIDRTF